jgi:hypothetical protein
MWDVSGSQSLLRIMWDASGKQPTMPDHIHNE